MTIQCPSCFSVLTSSVLISEDMPYGTQCPYCRNALPASSCCGSDDAISPCDDNDIEALQRLLNNLTELEKSCQSIMHDLSPEAQRVLRERAGIYFARYSIQSMAAAIHAAGSAISAVIVELRNKVNSWRY